MTSAAERAVARIVARQHGLFTRQEATRAGLTSSHLRARVARGMYRRLSPRVFAVAGVPSTWRQAVLAAVLAGGPGCVASHRTAAALLRFDGFAPGPPIEISVARTRNRFEAGCVVHLTQDLDASDRTVVDGIPCTAPARTLLDLAASHTPAVVEQALDGAERDGRVTRAQVLALLARTRRRGRPGVRVLEHVSGGGARPPTPIERPFLIALQRAGLPLPVPQYPVARGDGTTAFVDFAYPHARIAIELDGHRSHATRADRTHDARRGNDRVLAGWALYRFTDLDVDDGWIVANRIRLAMIAA